MQIVDQCNLLYSCICVISILIFKVMILRVSIKMSSNTIKYPNKMSYKNFSLGRVCFELPIVSIFSSLFNWQSKL